MQVCLCGVVGREQQELYESIHRMSHHSPSTSVSNAFVRVRVCVRVCLFVFLNCFPDLLMNKCLGKGRQYDFLQNNYIRWSTWEEIIIIITIIIIKGSIIRHKRLDTRNLWSGDLFPLVYLYCTWLRARLGQLGIKVISAVSLLINWSVLCWRTAPGWAFSGSTASPNTRSVGDPLR